MHFRMWDHTAKKKDRNNFHKWTERESVRGLKVERAEQFCQATSRFNKLTSVFHASVLLLIMNFIITSSK